MKAAVLEKIGAPLAIRELDLASHHDNRGGLLLLEPGQVLIKVLCAGICGSQLQEIDGIKGDPAHIPHLLGHEGCGIVVETGLGVTHVQKGDKVVMHWRKGAGMDVSGGIYGQIKSGPITTFSEYSIVSENRITKVPDDVPNDLACLFGCALSTALAIVENEARPNLGDLVCVFGCGGLGLSLILACISKGAQVIGIDNSQSKKSLIASLGATFLFPPYNISDFVAIWIDTIGSQVPSRFSGKYISLQKGGTSGGGFQPDKDIPRYIQMWRDGLLNDYHKLITHRIWLEDINKGIQLMRDGKAGRVLIEMQ